MPFKLLPLGSKMQYIQPRSFIPPLDPNILGSLEPYVYKLGIHKYWSCLLIVQGTIACLTMVSIGVACLAVHLTIKLYSRRLNFILPHTAAPVFVLILMLMCINLITFTFALIKFYINYKSYINCICI